MAAVVYVGDRARALRRDESRACRGRGHCDRGTFTRGAEAFAEGKRIDLINGRKLETFLSYARGERQRAS